MTKILTIFTLICFSMSSFANVKTMSRVSDVVDSDREARYQEINRITIKINEAQAELENFRYELGRAESDKSKMHREIVMRNVAGVVAAIGFCSTIIYQKQHVTPSAFILVGGYSISAISAVIMAIEHHGIQLSQKELTDLKASILKLENIIAVEKKNLQREIDLLNT